VNWDEPLPHVLKEKLETIMKGLESTTELRCSILIKLFPVSVCLHGFSNASECAYAAVLYISSTYNDNHTEVRLLCSKPSKQFHSWNFWILVRLVHSVTSSLPVLNDIYLWTNSITVLHWICNRKGRKQ